jgi:putative transport protein
MTGTLGAVEASYALLGDEIVAPPGFSVIEESREIILTNRVLSGRDISEIHDHATIETRHGCS